MQVLCNNFNLYDCRESEINCFYFVITNRDTILPVRYHRIYLNKCIHVYELSIFPSGLRDMHPSPITPSTFLKACATAEILTALKAINLVDFSTSYRELSYATLYVVNLLVYAQTTSSMLRYDYLAIVSSELVTTCWYLSWFLSIGLRNVA